MFKSKFSLLYNDTKIFVKPQKYHLNGDRIIPKFFLKTSIVIEV